MTVTSLASGVPRPQQVFGSSELSWLPAVKVSRDKDWPIETVDVGHLSNLSKFKYLAPNTMGCIWVLVVDIDKPDALETLLSRVKSGLPKPSWVVMKTSNGHLHAAWMITPVSTGEKSRRAPIDFALDVQRRLTQAFDGDVAFSVENKTLNPWWEGWRDHDTGYVIWLGDNGFRSLGDIAAKLPKLDKPKPDELDELDRRFFARRDPIPAEISRNCWVFDQTRLRTSGTVEDAAVKANASLPNPLRETEIRGIIRSIEKWEAGQSNWRPGTESGYSHARAVAMGAVGGSRNSSKQVLARSKGPAAASVVRAATGAVRAAEIMTLHEQGLTRSEIVSRLKVSESTVKRVIREARK